MILHLGLGFLHKAPLIVVLGVVARFVLPFIIGLAYILRDANRRGQPGWLWALLTLPLSWLAVLAYVIVRTFTPRA